MRPRIISDWWQVAGNPDLGAYGRPGQQPVDFAVWQAADGTWQLWSCIRHTACGGQTRLFYRWEGAALEQEHWEPKGIAMEAKPELGETAGGLQAPHVIRDNARYLLFYGDWNRICLATSADGKAFERRAGASGQPDLFAGPYGNSRDPMILKIGDVYHCYYTGHSEHAQPQAAVFCRTSEDLECWSEPVVVSCGGAARRQTDWYGGDCECPFVVERDGRFCLFRNQRYGPDSLNTQYCSPDPLDFGRDDDRYRVGTLPVAAPEILLDRGRHYIAALLPGLTGIRIAGLEWLD
ncbi:MAG: hypothetical protein BWZ02_00632 [Lentisphaerae bacterium ADurb.BinA184]|nr:MAG: hypothetical protein BWZ02_00632 [Lentisphaerae bacterium ADurb.BinA184]